MGEIEGHNIQRKLIDGTTTYVVFMRVVNLSGAGLLNRSDAGKRESGKTVR